jgi:hypothetical protein
MSVILLLTVFAGFARTLYLRPFFDVPAFPAYLLLAHGGVLSLWFLWFFIQTTLVASGRINEHRRMGMIGAGLAVAVVTVGSATLLGAVPRRIALGASIEENLWPLAALIWTNLSSLVGFAGFAAAAIVLRRRPAAHKRLMLLASISLTPAALVRIGALPALQVLDSQAMNVIGFAFLALLSLLLSLILYDLTSRGSVHRVTAWGAPGYFLFWLICLFVVPSTVIGGATVRWLAQ